MKTNKIKSDSLLILLFLFFITLAINPKLSVANPIPVNSKLWQHIGILPLDEDVNITMAQANVVLDIDAKTFNRFRIATSADYVFYNHNQTEIFTVVLPFDTSYSYEGAVTGPVDLRVNDTPLDFIEIELSVDQSDYLDDLISAPTPEIISVIAANVSFTGYSNTTLSYSSFNSFNRKNSATYVRITYYVSTGRVWYGNLTESVEFLVHGLQPDYYDEWNFDPAIRCQVSNISDGKSYLWEFEYDSYVTPEISYSSTDTRYFASYGLYILIGASIFVIVLSSLTMKLVKKKQK